MIRWLRCFGSDRDRRLPSSSPPASRAAPPSYAPSLPRSVIFFSHLTPSAVIRAPPPGAKGARSSSPSGSEFRRPRPLPTPPRGHLTHCGADAFPTSPTPAPPLLEAV